LKFEEEREMKFITKMKATSYLVWLVVPLLLLALAACAASARGEGGLRIQQAMLMEPDQKTSEVSTEELQTILLEKSATVFDARPFQEYAISHIPGALNVAAKPGVSIDLYVSDVAEVSRVLRGNKAAPIVLYCNGPFCGKSKRLAEELLEAGYTNVRRYQLGIPVWRALVGLTQIEAEGVRYVRDKDQTAVWIDARDPAESSASPIPNARNVLLIDVDEAKKDGRLPMEDHNTRIIVVGRDGAQAQAVAETIAQNAFHNVSYFAGPLEALRTTAELEEQGFNHEAFLIERLEHQIDSILADASRNPTRVTPQLNREIERLDDQIEMIRLNARKGVSVGRPLSGDQSPVRFDSPYPDTPYYLDPDWREPQRLADSKQERLEAQQVQEGMLDHATTAPTKEQQRAADSIEERLEVQRVQEMMLEP
jgi:rhodanese-related sulfurtransferase